MGHSFIHFWGFSRPLQRFLLCFRLPPPWAGVGAERRSLSTHFLHPRQGGSHPHTALCGWGLASSEHCATSREAGTVHSPVWLRGPVGCIPVLGMCPNPSVCKRPTPAQLEKTLLYFPAQEFGCFACARVGACSCPQCTSGALGWEQTFFSEIPTQQAALIDLLTQI